LGSVVGGSTPMGGGSVAFPILVLAFKRPSASARDLMIQALEMTSALLFMIDRKVSLPVRLLAGSAIGAGFGLLTGTLWLVPRFPESSVKLLFSCLWMSFALLTLARNGESLGLQGGRPEARAGWLGFAAGVDRRRDSVGYRSRR
jgi:uncharacterized protein